MQLRKTVLRLNARFDDADFFMACLHSVCDTLLIALACMHPKFVRFLWTMLYGKFLNCDDFEIFLEKCFSHIFRWCDFFRPFMLQTSETTKLY